LNPVVNLTKSKSQIPFAGLHLTAARSPGAVQKEHLLSFT
jgi:hypothetical protein